MNTLDWSLASQAGWVVFFGLASVLRFGLWHHMQAERYSWVRLFVFQINLGHHSRVEGYSYVLHLYFRLVLHHGKLKRYSWIFNLYSSLVFDLFIFWSIIVLACVLQYALWHHRQIVRGVLLYGICKPVWPLATKAGWEVFLGMVFVLQFGHWHRRHL